MKRVLLIFTVIVSAFIGAILGVILTIRYLPVTTTYTSIEAHQKSVMANYSNDSSQIAVPNGLNFEKASRLVTPAVVHVRTTYGPGNFSHNPFEQDFNPHGQSSGSGVIISDDGYIVTNNHVIEDGSTIEVVMNNNQRFYARLVGADPTTDLALLKIKARALPFVKYGDSDNIKTGQWVLAIGNPFDLNSTVTAGIISARARNIKILEDKKNHLEVESFIQTDAAVNPGNSGGALVNLNGELIGINSAMATSTGGYAGYSFAIPTSLVKKIMDDLLEFGQVQRGLLGVEIRDVTAALAEELDLDVLQGVYIAAIHKGSAAGESGIEEGDVITAINQHPIGNVSEMQEWVARNRPGQFVSVTFRRNKNERKVKVKLKNFEGSEKLSKKEIAYELEGATFGELSYKELTVLNLDGGVIVKSLKDGKWKKAGVKEGFIVTHIDKVAVDNVTDLNRILELKNGGILVEGFYAGGRKGVYGIAW
jgi:serine protease Do